MSEQETFAEEREEIEECRIKTGTSLILCSLMLIISIGLFVGTLMIHSGIWPWGKQAENVIVIQDETESVQLGANEGADVTEDVMPEIPSEDGGKMTGEDYVPVVLPAYEIFHRLNPHMVGWLYIPDTRIDYPVMQTPEDEDYYLNRGFNGEESANGCLLMDTDSVVGDGTKEFGYVNGTAPSDNLIIHGHTMNDGEMFGELDLYAKEDYGREHSIIYFDSLYEKREYEVISVFYSQVFYKDQDVFKYYKFFEAEDEAAFDDWYENITDMSLYDTGVTAEFGDEFITLSCCAYHVENGRFVVVAKRVK